MGSQAAKIKEISLDEEFGDVAVKLHGARVEIHTDGSVLAYTNGNVKACPASNSSVSAASSAAPRIGDSTPDGIYAGISPDTKKPMYAMPADAPLSMIFNEAANYAQKLNAEKYLGHDDWRVPAKDELNVLFNNRAEIGGFNVSGSYPAGWYWSATPFNLWLAWCQRFSDGAQNYTYEDYRSSVRCVR